MKFAKIFQMSSRKKTVNSQEREGGYIGRGNYIFTIHASAESSFYAANNVPKQQDPRFNKIIHLNSL